MTTLHLPEVRGRLSLREQVAAVLRTALISGQLQPGTTYSIPTLAEQLGVSATPVREAMLDLVQQGILVAVPNKGFRVVEMSDADLDALTEVRRMLEVPAVARASGALDDESIAHLRALAEQVRDAAAVGDLVAFLEGDREFHRALLAAAGNPRLVEIVDGLRMQSRLYGLGELAADGTLVSSAEEHVALLDAVASGDSAGAADLMGHHLDHVRGRWARGDE